MEKSKSDEIAIKAEGVSKTFRIPHEKINTVKGAFINVFKKTTYEEFKALDNVSFEVKKGEFFGIIGRNGSGKSTLLKILAGVYQSDNGKIKINGRISPFLELGIGFNSELSGRDNIYLNAAVLGLSKRQIDKKFDEIVAFSELERFIDQKLKNYSSGMQVRLAFSVAIHANRDILLMDEVLAVGDINFQQKCLEEFNRYHDLGKTVILVTHSMETVRRYCDRAMLLREGKVEIIGNPGEVSDKYMYQNISDEEMRLLEDEKEEVEEKGKAKEERKVEKKIIEIIGVEFLDKYKRARNVFKTGDDISVRVYFKINEARDRFDFGLGLYNQEDEYITGIHSIIDKIETKDYLKKGYFQVDFKEIPLKTNSYYVKVGIVGKEFMPYYDFLGKSKFFKIIYPGENQEGITVLNYKWNK